MKISGHPPDLRENDQYGPMLIALSETLPEMPGNNKDNIVFIGAA